MRFFIRLTVCVFAILAVTTWSYADMIWDEQQAGDLRPETDPTPIVLPIGESDIRGTVGGDPNDPLQDAYDAFVFDVRPGEQWDQFTLVMHAPNPPNQTTGIVVYEGANSTSGVFLNGVPAAGANVDLFQMMVLGPFGPGTYTVGIRDFESVGNVYQLRLGVVPEPTGILGMAWVLLILPLARRR